jgi:GNAT superfamily N-acetyltransferase
LAACVSGLAASDAPEAGTFEAIFEALDATSRPLVGPARPRLLVIPIRDDVGAVVGGLWGCTVFGWLHVQMLFVPEQLRGLGIGSALMAAAEAAARERGCHGAYVDTFSFQAAPFYRKLGFAPFGVLDDFPPGHRRLFFCKRFGMAPA